MNDKPKLIYSPQEHIPIGEPTISSDGIHGICFKWKRNKKENVKEVVPLDKLNELVIIENLKKR